MFLDVQDSLLATPLILDLTILVELRPLASLVLTVLPSCHPAVSLTFAHPSPPHALRPRSSSSDSQATRAHLRPGTQERRHNARRTRPPRPRRRRRLRLRPRPQQRVHR